MKDAAVPEFRQVLPAPPPRTFVARLRRAAATFWLNYFFWHAKHTPWITRSTKGFYLWCALRCSNKIRRSTMANARRLLGAHVSEREQLDFGKRVISHFYDFVYDVGRSRKMSREQLLAEIESTEGTQHYDAARQLRKGAIVVTAHMGSFEVGLAALLQRDRKIHVVFKRDELGRFEQLRQAMRKRLGVIEAPIDDGWTVWLRLRDALLADEIVVVQGDRVMPGQKGQRVPFPGGHILLPTGPMKLAIASGAPIVPVFSVRTVSKKIRLFIEEPIMVDPAAPSVDGIHPAMLQLAATIGKYVGAYPDQWLVLDRAFCEDAEESSKTKSS